MNIYGEAEDEEARASMHDFLGNANDGEDKKKQVEGTHRFSTRSSQQPDLGRAAREVLGMNAVVNVIQGSRAVDATQRDLQRVNELTAESNQLTNEIGNRNGIANE